MEHLIQLVFYFFLDRLKHPRYPKHCGNMYIFRYTRPRIQFVYPDHEANCGIVYPNNVVPPLDMMVCQPLRHSYDNA